MKSFQLNAMTSDVIISLYVIVTLFLRFKFEQESTVHPIESIVMGVCFVTIIWVLIKLKILNPNWFGLINSKKSKS
jgi:hypothetical protein